MQKHVPFGIMKGTQRATNVPLECAKGPTPALRYHFASAKSVTTSVMFDEPSGNRDPILKSDWLSRYVSFYSPRPKKSHIDSRPNEFPKSGFGKI